MFLFVIEESSEHLPLCVIQFWKPILQIILNDNNLISIIIDKIFNIITNIYGLVSNNPSIIDRQRIGWIFYLIEQPLLKLDLCSIFIRFSRILQPWFTDSLSQMVTQMSDDTNRNLITEEKRDLLLQIISMFANPLENIEENQITTKSALEILPRNELYKKEILMFKKSSNFKTKFYKHKNILFFLSFSILGEILAEVPMGLINNEDEQNLEMNIDLSKTERNCRYFIIFSMI